MVESKSKRDICTKNKIAYIGDDTGLVKKVKVVSKIIEEAHEVRYDIDNRKKRSVKQGEDVERGEVRAKPSFVYRKPNSLSINDN